MINFERPRLMTIFLSFLLFLFFVALMFPYRNLKGWAFGKLYQTTHILILADDIGPNLLGWPGLSAKRVDVTIPMGDSELDLSADKVITRMRLWGFTPAVSLNMKRLKEGGDLFVKLGQSGQELYVDSSASGVQLQQITLPGFAQTLNGKVWADVDLALGMTDLSRASGSISAEIESLKIPTLPIRMSAEYGFAIPAMNVGQAKANIKIRNGMAEIQAFQLGNAQSDMSGTVTGEVRLGKTLMQSSMNLTFRIQFSPAIKANPQSETMLSFLNSFKNEKTGNYAFRCNKPLYSAADCLLSPEKIAD